MIFPKMWKFPKNSHLTRFFTKIYIAVSDESTSKTVERLKYLIVLGNLKHTKFEQLFQSNLKTFWNQQV